MQCPNCLSALLRITNVCAVLPMDRPRPLGFRVLDMAADSLRAFCVLTGTLPPTAAVTLSFRCRQCRKECEVVVNEGRAGVEISGPHPVHQQETNGDGPK